MTFDSIVVSMQQAVIALGTFVCLWGFAEFWPCFRAVLLARQYPHNNLCPHHAAGGMICIVGLTFTFARATTIGWLPFTDTAAGLAFIGGMIVFTLVVGLAIWAKDRSTGEYPQQFTPPTLSRIFYSMLIIILCFCSVGLVKAA